MGKNKGDRSAKAIKPGNEIQVKGASTAKNDMIAKRSQANKAKTKEVTKNIAAAATKGAAPNGKKSKKVPVKEPTPEPSSEEEEDSDESESAESAEESASDSESDDASEAGVKPVAAKLNGKATAKVNGSTATVAKEPESSESSESSESDDEPVAPKSAPAAAVVAAKEDAASDDDSSEESDSDASVAAAKVNGAADPKTAVSGALKKTSSSDTEAESGASDASDDSEEESDSSDGSSEGEPAPKKRKAEAEPAPAAKKAKTQAGAIATAGADAQSNLFVGQLSWNIDEDWLTRAFEGFGELTGARVVMDRDSGRSRGFGYVEFAKPEDAAKALADMNGHELDGRAINVDFAGRKDNAGEGTRGRADSRAKGFKDEISPPSETLFVGNISFEASEDIVSEAFGKFATVQSVRLPTDPDTGDLKGFGYVQFGSISDATAAYEGMKSGEICGRAIRLDYGKPRADNGGGRGGRGGGRGFGGGRGRGGDRGGRGGGRGRGGFGDRGGRGGGRGGRGDSKNRGGFGDFQGKKTSF